MGDTIDIFLVVAPALEYDDEGYYEREGNGDIAAAFLTEEAALAAVSLHDHVTDDFLWEDSPNPEDASDIERVKRGEWPGFEMYDPRLPGERYLRSSAQYNAATGKWEEKDVPPNTIVVKRFSARVVKITLDIDAEHALLFEAAHRLNEVAIRFNEFKAEVERRVGA